MPAVGRWFVTPHAVERYRERVPGAGALTYEQALAALVSESETARFVKDLGNGLDLWRGRKPHRLRFRVSHAEHGRLPQLVTVLRGCDPGWQR